MASLEEPKGLPDIPLDDEARKEEDSYCHALQLVVSSVLSFSMQSAIELGVFDIIAKEGPNAKLSSSEIAAHIGTTTPDGPMMLDRLLAVLASNSVLDCTVVNGKLDKCFRRLYSLTPVSKYFVTNEDGVSLAPVLTMVQDEAFLKGWRQVKDAVIEGGIAFERAHGMHHFQYPSVDHRFNKIFNKAMFNHSTTVMKRILKLYKGFEHVTQLVDVGGNLGGAISLITSKYPHIKGINFDLPHVIKHASSYPSVENVGGDMFESIPNGDAIFLKHILHDWLDKDCIKLLKNCYNAIPDNGKVIVVEALLPIKPDSNVSVRTNGQLDLHMMTQAPGGMERSQEEFMALATAAGFSGIRYECFTANLWIMEFYK
ncbi:caffeic acid 3-O-methyltransferase-like [Pyrus x bretschneideri]|uniref:caffeic acid 3-O-methyltransferase-like n=1 Tax=Pyrus x bretschneideri TaxID=225117 RepID=UPI00202EFB5F|nr:caffeic acid 3-O-methyltransferase-like [Pyrus x bretschneideri]